MEEEAACGDPDVISEPCGSPLVISYLVACLVVVRVLAVEDA